MNEDEIQGAPGPEFGTETAAGYDDDPGLDDPGFDDDLTPPQDEETGLVAPAAPALVVAAADLPAPEAAARPVDAPIAPAMTLPALTPEERERFNEMLAADPLTAMDNYVSYRLAQAEQARAVQDFHIQEIAEVAPDFVRVHQHAMQRTMAQLPAQVRGTREGVHTAIAYALLEEMNATKDPAAVLARAAQLMTGRRAAASAPAAASRPVVPPAQRVPSPGLGGAGAARHEAAAPARRNESEATRFLKTLGMSAQEAARWRDL